MAKVVLSADGVVSAAPATLISVSYQSSAAAPWPVDIKLHDDVDDATGPLMATVRFPSGHAAQETRYLNMVFPTGIYADLVGTLTGTTLTFEIGAV